MIHLEKYMPRSAVAFFIKKLDGIPLTVLVKHGRTSKKGDFALKGKTKDKYQITINAELDPYDFTITFAHELAHLYVVRETGSFLKPHGKLWKKTFGDILIQLTYESVFPEKIAKGVVAYVDSGVRAKECNIELIRLCDQSNDRPVLPLLEDIGKGKAFMLRNMGPFIKGEKRRTTYRCRKAGTRKYYIISKLARVQIVEN